MNSILLNYFLLKKYTKSNFKYKNKNKNKNKNKFFQMSSYLEKTIKFKKYYKKGISDMHRNAIRKIA